MTILSQYMMRTILASTALVLVVLLAIAGLFEFIAELDDIQGDYQTPQAILFTALRLPNLAFEMLPVAVLIGRRQYERLIMSHRRFSEAYREFPTDVDLEDLAIDPDELFGGARTDDKGREVRL